MNLLQGSMNLLRSNINLLRINFFFIKKTNPRRKKMSKQTRSAASKSAALKSAASKKPAGKTRDSNTAKSKISAAEKALSAASAKAKKSTAAKDIDLAEYAIEIIEPLLDVFITDEQIGTTMTGRQRLRLFGAGVRNYGFIEKAYDIARDNPQFVPKQFYPIVFGAEIQKFITRRHSGTERAARP
jgi:hypothetical protein